MWLTLALASVLFGLYHIAHSPPFNTWTMIGGLTLVGLVTSLFFFTTRDVDGTIVFHNFFALFGVVRALGEAGALVRYETLQPPLLIPGILTLGLIVAVRRFVIGPRAVCTRARRARMKADDR